MTTPRKTGFRATMFGLIALVAMLAAPSAFARSHWSVGVNIGGPGWGVGYSDCRHCGWRGGYGYGYVGAYYPAYYPSYYYTPARYYGYYDNYYPSYTSVYYYDRPHYSHTYRGSYYHDGYRRHDDGYRHRSHYNRASYYRHD